MPLTIPRLDDRAYADLLRDAMSRIPVHTPEWTNFNDSDPGVTLLQLFAFMTETLLYRANLIPERNRKKFLELLGIPLRPPSAATGAVTIVNERGPMQTVTLPSGVPVFAGRTGFVTTRALDVLPIDARVYYRRPLSTAEAADASAAYTMLFGSILGDDTEADFYRTVPFDPPTSAANLSAVDLGGNDTIDRSLWVALLARRGEEGRADALRGELAGKTITLGMAPDVEADARTLHPGGTQTAAPVVPLLFELSTGVLKDGVPEYLTLDPRLDGNPLEQLTMVELTLPEAERIRGWDDLDPTLDGLGDLPPALDDPAVRGRVIAWVRVRVQGPNGGAPPAGVRLRFTWLGINATGVTQRIDVVGEPLGTGTGEPDQRVAVANTPLLPESVRLVVGGEPWTLTDDLLAAPPEVVVRDPALPPGTTLPAEGDPRVFVGDAESGFLLFGTGLHGKRPPARAPIFASYGYGGGRAGNVGIGALKSSPLLPAGFKVSNPLPTWGGSEGETVADAERAIPRILKHADRAVSREDYADIVQRTPGIDLGRVNVLPLFHPDVGSPSPGVVTVLVIPIDLSKPDAPEPDQFFLQAVCAWLEPRRVLTAEVHVRGPDYVGIAVSIGVDVVPGREVSTVREAVKAEIRRFLSPLQGGVDGTGWPLDKVVEDRELLVRAARITGVAKVRDVRVWSATGTTTATIPIAGLQLPRLDRISVAVGDAEDLAPAPAPKPKRRLPVPVIPVEC